MPVTRKKKVALAVGGLLAAAAAAVAAVKTVKAIKSRRRMGIS